MPSGLAGASSAGSGPPCGEAAAAGEADPVVEGLEEGASAAAAVRSAEVARAGAGDHAILSLFIPFSKFIMDSSQDQAHLLSPLETPGDLLELLSPGSVLVAVLPDHLDPGFVQASQAALRRHPRDASPSSCRGRTRRDAEDRSCHPAESEAARAPAPGIPSPRMRVRPQPVKRA